MLPFKTNGRMYTLGEKKDEVFHICYIKSIHCVHVSICSDDNFFVLLVCPS